MGADGDPLGAAAAGGPVDCSLQLRLVHLRAAADPVILCLLVQLVARSPLRARVGAPSAPPARGDVRSGQSRRTSGFPRPRALLVDRTSGDLLGALLAPPALSE